MAYGINRFRKETDICSQLIQYVSKLISVRVTALFLVTCSFILIIITKHQVALVPSIPTSAIRFPKKHFSNASVNATEKKRFKSIDELLHPRICSNLSQKCPPVDSSHHLPFFLHLGYSAKQTVHTLQSSVLLVVGFNLNTHYDVSPIIHALYSSTFAAIRFCGLWPDSRHFIEQIEDSTESRQIAEDLAPLYISYLNKGEKELIKGRGEGVQYCVNRAIDGLGDDLRNNLRGAMFIQDDVLFNYHGVTANDDMFNLSKSWIFPVKRVYSIRSLVACETSDNYCRGDLLTWWPASKYRTQTYNFFNELHDLSADPSGEDLNFAKICSTEISNNLGGLRRAAAGMSDAFYISSRHFHLVLPMFALAKKHHVFQEITIATTLSCLPSTEVGFFDPTRVIAGNQGRSTPWEMFDSQRLLVHPFKLGELAKNFAGNSNFTDNMINESCLICSLIEHGILLAAIQD